MDQNNQTDAIKALMQQDPYKNFIKTDQINVKFFPCPPFDKNTLDGYRNGFERFWDAIFKNPKGSPLHDQATAKLAEATRKLYAARKEELSKVRAAAQGPNRQENNTLNAGAPQGNGNTAMNTQASSRQQLPHGHQQNQTHSNPNPQQALNEAFPPDIQAKVDEQTWVLPVHLAPGTAEGDKYLREASRRFGTELMKQRAAILEMKECETAMQQAQAAQAAGKDVTAMVTTIRAKREAAQMKARDAHEWVEKIINVNTKHQLEHQQAGRGPMSQQNGNSAQGRPGMVANPYVNRTGNAGEGIALNLPPNYPPQAQAQTQNFARQAPGHPMQAAGLPTNPQAGEPPTKTYTPQQAVALSRSQPQPSPAQAAPQSAQPFQPDRQPSQGDLDHQRRPGQPISKGWQPQPPQPVAMGPSRPTLAGPNSGPLGAMGAPAITKADTFLLQGPGDHVLDKKKLNELVRQVCGADAGDGDALRPEVEETILQLADEFVDNVVIQACKLAKLRGSTFLELRDLQLVLERQYNIRVPGFGTDELRTVRKGLPVPAYYQKMQAVQAAKVMGNSKTEP